MIGHTAPGKKVHREQGRTLFAIEGDVLATQSELVAAALALGARDVRGWSSAEQQLTSAAGTVPKSVVHEVRDRIRAGDDPLGEAFCRLRLPAERRAQGATYTPRPIVEAMVAWGTQFPDVMRVVDPGVGSGRYLVSAGRRIPQAALLGIEIDPLPAILARANLAVWGLAERSEVVLGDYRGVRIPPVAQRTLFIGNPPYVRHHLLGARWKAWLRDQAARLGHSASQLAGLHVHFFLATVLNAAVGDVGAFITAAEWLDVNYGRLVRELFLGRLGGQRIEIIEPTVAPFPDAAATAAITYFQVGASPEKIRVRRIETLAEFHEPNGAPEIPRERLQRAPRWTLLTRTGKKAPQGYIALGDICRVHRGQVTGLNRVWIAGPHSLGLPDRVLLPTVTKARELFEAGDVLDDASALRRVIDLPIDLDVFDRAERRAVERFLARAKSLGAHEGYVATNRKAWWSVGLRPPAPVLATYMARRPPAFVVNRAQARHLNIAHGLYPRVPLSHTVLRNLVAYLSRNVQVTQGRTYAGGLTKFEPREMERILIPAPELLSQGNA